MINIASLDKLKRQSVMQDSELSMMMLRKCIDRILSNEKVKEVPFVVALAHVLPIVLTKLTCSRYFDGFRHRCLKFKGSIIHGHPTAEFVKNSKKTRCELGDLMITCKDHTESIRSRQSAVLLQAKVSEHEENEHVLSGPSSLNQLELYSKWPEFSLKEIKGSRYDLCPKMGAERAQYLIVRGWRCPKAIVVKPEKGLKIGYPSLGVYVMRMLKMQGGQEYDEQQGDGNLDGWSRLVKDVESYVSTHNMLRCTSLCEGVTFPRISSADVISYLSNDVLRMPNREVERIVDEIVTELPDWARQNSKAKCFGILTIECHEVLET